MSDVVKTQMVPLCQRCGGWMVFCVAIPGMEFVCPACGAAEEFFNGCDRLEVRQEEYDAIVVSVREKLAPLYTW